MSLSLLTAPNLSQFSGLKHGFTTRLGGVSEGVFASLNLGHETGDQDEWVGKNYERLAETFGTTTENLIGTHQVHGAGVVKVEKGGSRDDYLGTDADSLITNVRGLFLTIRVADCLPILLIDEEHEAIAAVHSGWRGTLAKVLPATIAEMTDLFRTNPARVSVAIGPGIGVCCYEVAFGISALMEQELGFEKGETQEKESGVHLNLAKINARLAGESGISPERIWLSGLCTRCDEKRFYSYRRDGKKSGRMVGIIGFNT